MKCNSQYMELQLCAPESFSNPTSYLQMTGVELWTLILHCLSYSVHIFSNVLIHFLLLLLLLLQYWGWFYIVLSSLSFFLVFLFIFLIYFSFFFFTTSRSSLCLFSFSFCHCSSLTTLQHSFVCIIFYSQLIPNTCILMTQSTKIWGLSNSNRVPYSPHPNKKWSHI